MFITVVPLGLSQPLTHYTASFRISAAQVDAISGKLNDYLVNVGSLIKLDDSGRLYGTLFSFIGTRDWRAPSKTVYDLDYFLRYAISGRKITLDFYITGGTTHTIICDNAQQETSRKITIAELPESLTSDFQYFADQVAKQANFFIENNSGRFPRGPHYPYFYTMPYVYESSGALISYYKIIQSEKNLNKLDIYKRIQEFCSLGNAVIQRDDSDDYKILAKGVRKECYWRDERPIEFVFGFILNVECRDGRAKVVISLSREGNLYYEDRLSKAENQVSRLFDQIQKSVDKGNSSLDSLKDW